MKILLLGANGQVGFELARALAPLGELCLATRDGKLLGAGRCVHADLANPETLSNALHAFAPDIVVNTAMKLLAWTLVLLLCGAEPQTVEVDARYHPACGLGADRL